MKPALRLGFSCMAAVLVLAGCGKKEPAPAGGTAQSQPVAEEQVLNLYI